MATERLDELPLGEVPLVVRTQLVVGSGGELGAGLDAEEPIEIPEVLETAVELGVDLLLGTEDVCVVLGDVTDAC